MLAALPSIFSKLSTKSKEKAPLLESRTDNRTNKTCHLQNCDFVALKQADKQVKTLATLLNTQRTCAHMRVEARDTASACPSLGQCRRKIMQLRR
ncbi:hypothetical protein DFH09DRAFT_1333486 [Mycena vulgaris]|nr:hypothetical protein DFH09DRAFT_1333486 [Mycena vulgaris]